MKRNLNCNETYGAIPSPMPVYARPLSIQRQIYLLNREYRFPPQQQVAALYKRPLSLHNSCGIGPFRNSWYSPNAYPVSRGYRPFAFGMPPTAQQMMNINTHMKALKLANVRK